MDLTNKIFYNADAARKLLEALRWPDGAHCPHCGGVDKIAAVAVSDEPRKPVTKVKKHHPARKGLHYCGDCKKTFTVTVGTVVDRSRILLNKWVPGFHIMAPARKGISVHQLHRQRNYVQVRLVPCDAHP